MTRLIAFDLEGTIFKANHKIEGVDFASTMWQLLACKIDVVEQEKETHDKWENGIYQNYGEWVEDTFNIHKKYKLTQEIFNDVIATAEYNEGVIDFFKLLDRREWMPVIISGAFQELVDKACKDLDVKYGYGACRYTFNFETGLLDKYNYDPCDFKGKFGKFSMITEEEGINEDIFIFVGDGKNDEVIARKASIAFGINPHNKLKAIPGLIEISSFMDIFGYLDNVEEIAKEVKKKKQDEKNKQNKINKNEWPKDGKILIIGNSNLTEGIVSSKAKEYKINNTIEYNKEYDNKFDFKIIKNNKAYSYLFLGQMPHKVKGLESANNIQTQIKNNPELYPRLYINDVEMITLNNLEKFFKWVNADKNDSKV